MSKLLIVTEQSNVLSELLKNCFDVCDQVTPMHVLDKDLEAYDAFAILGGTTKEGMVLLPPMRKALDQQIFKGKKCFAEYVRGIGQTSFLEVKNTRFARPVLINSHEITGDLPQFTMFNEQTNDRIVVYKATNRTTPILQYVDYPRGFYVMRDTEYQNDLSKYAMWEEGSNLLVCSFRLCNFSKAKFSPRHAWAQLFSGIVNYLGGTLDKATVMALFDKEYTLCKSQTIEQAAERAMAWFQNADMLVEFDGAPYCVREGAGSDVYPDGTHAIAEELREDNAGRTALAHLIKSMWKKSDADKKIADGIFRMVLDMQVQEGPHKGHIHGNCNAWWNVSYHGDSSAGFTLPLLLRQLLTGDRQYEPQIKLALDYMLSTVGTDGLRRDRFDYYDVFKDEVIGQGPMIPEEVKLENGETGIKWTWGESEGPMTREEYTKLPGSVPITNDLWPSLLLYYKLTGDKKYLDAGVKGVSKIMSYYPYTGGSSTGACSLFSVALVMLYWATGEEEHKQWLYRVVKDLQKFRHPKGGYVEWDEGHLSFSHAVDDGECSLLAENGNPVMDLLYTLNWLPKAFILAYYVTGDPWFKELWRDICQFFANAQLKSDNKLLDGGWPRSFDADLQEIYGIPNDVGWAPWSIESGWTVAEVATGMMLGLMEDQVKPLFDALK